MISKKELLKSWKIYPVLVDSLFRDRKELVSRFHALIDSDIDCIQLRFKSIAEREIFELARKMTREARQRGIPVIIDDRPETAVVLGADGVHIGKADVDPRIARKLLGKKAIIGRTTRAGIKELETFDPEYVDYLSVGPLFPTPTKPDLKALPHSRVKRFVREVDMPVVGIGAVGSGNADRVKALGIKTVAFVRYAVTYGNTKTAIKELGRIMEDD
ncbi:MAG: thiamine phosphate synthase [Candidatus Omnitrophica bacterium]|nr:thiamine phosphate synthase [Candidatus Omnitrophota bacterium]